MVYPPNVSTTLIYNLAPCREVTSKQTFNSRRLRIPVVMITAQSNCDAGDSNLVKYSESRSYPLLEPLKISWPIGNLSNTN